MKCESLFGSPSLSTDEGQNLLLSLDQDIFYRQMKAGKKKLT